MWRGRGLSGYLAAPIIRLQATCLGYVVQNFTIAEPALGLEHSDDVV